MPSIRLTSLLDVLAGQELVLGMFLAGAGLAFLMLGARMTRVITALSFGVGGFVAGSMMLASPEMQVVGGMLIALALAALAVTAVKVGVGVLSGLWVGGVAMAVAGQLGLEDQFVWIFGLLGFAAAVSVAFVLFRETVAFVSSLEGTFLFLGGLIIFASQSPALWGHFRDMLIRNPVFGPFIILAGTVTGFYLQMAEIQKKQAGQSA